MNFVSNQPEQLSFCSSSSQDAPIDIDSILQNQRKSEQINSNQFIAEQQTQNQSTNKQGKQDSSDDLDEIELEMLIEQCEELIAKVSPNAQSFYLQNQASFSSDINESFCLKKQKNRLEKDYIDLCIEIQRQQKQLQNYRFKVQVAQKQAEYYGRQIKQKSLILQSLEKHSSNKGKQTFRK